MPAKNFLSHGLAKISWLFGDGSEVQPANPFENMFGHRHGVQPTEMPKHHEWPSDTTPHQSHFDGSSHLDLLGGGTGHFGDFS
jgi:hypothetical protein